MNDQETILKECPLCSDGRIARVLPNVLAYEFKCNCGIYAATRQETYNLRSWAACSPELAVRLGILCREQLISGGKPYLIFTCDPPIDLPGLSAYVPGNAAEILRSWPSDVSTMLDRIMLNLSRLHPAPGEAIATGSDGVSIYFAKSAAEKQFFLSALRDIGLLRSTSGSILEITARGWDRIRDLTRQSGSKANPVFVAMWFGSDQAIVPFDMREVYEHGIRRGIANAGYRAHREDVELAGVDYIMDSVLANIKRAPFVVSDLTNHRNGVYFEAGFARGLGLKTFQTCFEPNFEKAHFDVGQIKTLRWRTIQELRDGLHARILANIGPGPFDPQPPPVS